MPTGIHSPAAYALLLGAALATPIHAAETEPLPVDEIKVREITETGPRIYYRHAGNTIAVLSANELKRLGQFATGNSPLMLPPFEAGGEIYIASSYYSRGTWGDREDVLEYYDNNTLKRLGEIQIPARHTVNQSLRTLIQPSADGEYIFIQNATPATSVTIVDTEGKTVTGELNTPGCWGIYPSLEGHKFSTICGDGTFASYTLNEDGTDATRTASEKIFDVDDDALFVHSETVGTQTVFVSFTGNVYVMDLEAETPALVEKFSIVDGVEGAWRPGGHQLAAYLPDTGKLYVLMHDKGKEGTHKTPAKEIWTVDLTDKTVTERTQSRPLISITGYGPQNTLYGVDYKDRSAIRYLTDPASGAPVEQKAFGISAAPRQIEVR